MASPCRSSAIPCLICRYRGATRLLIYCAKCKQVSIHRYCLSKFYREDESIHWICWKCEARIHWERKVSARKVEKHSRTLKGNDVKRSYVQRSNLTRRNTQGSQVARTLKGNDVPRSDVIRRATRKNQGARRMISENNLALRLDKVQTKEKGRLINLEARFQCSIYSSSKHLRSVTKDEDFYPLRFSRKACRDVTRESSQVRDLNKQGKGIQRRRKMILDDIDSEEEYEQRDNKNKGERKKPLVTCGTSYYEEDSEQVLKNKDEIDKLQSHTTCQRMCNNGFLLKGVEHAKPIDLKRTNKLLQNPKRVIHDGSEFDEECQQKKK